MNGTGANVWLVLLSSSALPWSAVTNKIPFTLFTDSITRASSKSTDSTPMIVALVNFQCVLPCHRLDSLYE